MIPKKIHYCWFGGKPLPDDARRYIDSWRRYMPDFEIVRWDESNFDVSALDFTSEAYEVGKFAYVSDYARLRVLYDHGGVYFDTDVEVIAPIDDLLEHGGFMGFEKNSLAAPGEMLYVNPGLGFAVEPHNHVVREALDFYESHHYIYPDGHLEQITIVTIVTDILRRRGLSRSDVPTTIDGITIYPCDYFCPVEFLSSRLEITPHTRTIHHYSASWMSLSDRLLMRRGRLVAKLRRLFCRR